MADESGGPLTDEVNEVKDGHSWKRICAAFEDEAGDSLEDCLEDDKSRVPEPWVVNILREKICSSTTTGCNRSTSRSTSTTTPTPTPTHDSTSTTTPTPTHDTTRRSLSSSSGSRRKATKIISSVAASTLVLEDFVERVLTREAADDVVEDDVLDDTEDQQLRTLDTKSVLEGDTTSTRSQIRRAMKVSTSTSCSSSSTSRPCSGAGVELPGASTTTKDGKSGALVRKFFRQEMFLSSRGHKSELLSNKSHDEEQGQAAKEESTINSSFLTRCSHLVAFLSKHYCAPLQRVAEAVAAIDEVESIRIAEQGEVDDSDRLAKLSNAYVNLIKAMDEIQPFLASSSGSDSSGKTRSRCRDPDVEDVIKVVLVDDSVVDDSVEDSRLQQCAEPPKDAPPPMKKRRVVKKKGALAESTSTSGGKGVNTQVEVDVSRNQVAHNLAQIYALQGKRRDCIAVLEKNFLRNYRKNLLLLAGGGAAKRTQSVQHLREQSQRLLTLLLQEGTDDREFAAELLTFLGYKARFRHFPLTTSGEEDIVQQLDHTRGQLSSTQQRLDPRQEEQLPEDEDEVPLLVFDNALSATSLSELRWIFDRKFFTAHNYDPLLYDCRLARRNPAYFSLFHDLSAPRTSVDKVLKSFLERVIEKLQQGGQGSGNVEASTSVKKVREGREEVEEDLRTATCEMTSSPASSTTSPRSTSTTNDPASGSTERFLEVREDRKKRLEHFASQLQRVRYAETWTHRRSHLGYHQLHVDSKDEGQVLNPETGKVENPIATFVLFLQCRDGGTDDHEDEAKQEEAGRRRSWIKNDQNDSTNHSSLSTTNPSSSSTCPPCPPTVITTQRLGSEAATLDAATCHLVFPKENRAVCFSGDLYHGVVPGKILGDDNLYVDHGVVSSLQQGESASGSGEVEESSAPTTEVVVAYRHTVMISLWENLEPGKPGKSMFRRQLQTEAEPGQDNVRSNVTTSSSEPGEEDGRTSTGGLLTGECDWKHKAIFGRRGRGDQINADTSEDSSGGSSSDIKDEKITFASPIYGGKVWESVTGEGLDASAKDFHFHEVFQF
ncbi:unnamed protein product [Amoebophrya sp. A25]|nr:unnamed protein product [Amoebophrya sp. A25]|eukprot:GSA25T00006469001.1